VLNCVQLNTTWVFFMTTTLTIRLEKKLKGRLDYLAEATQRSKSFLAAEAIRDFIELNEWQIQEIKEAVQEADDGDFASDDAVKKTLSPTASDPA
jgi:RHH-type rel operon transcriptional repressor/antitoxin RelB